MKKRIFYGAFLGVLVIVSSITIMLNGRGTSKVDKSGSRRLNDVMNVSESNLDGINPPMVQGRMRERERLESSQRVEGLRLGILEAHDIVHASTSPVFSEDFEGAFPGDNWLVGDANSNNGLDYWDDTSYRPHGGSWSGWCADIGTKVTTATVFYEDFEGAWPGSWTVGDSTAESGYDYWGDYYYMYHEGHWSGYCADEGSHPSGCGYDNDMNAYMYRSVSLSEYSSVTLSYYYWLDCEPNYDYLYFIYWDGDWHFIDEHTGNSGGWQYSSVSVPTLASYVGLHFYSDSSVCSYDGAFVDEVQLKGTSEVPNDSVHEYDNNMDAYMVRKYVIDASSWSSATLSYYTWYQTESSWDYLQVIVTNDAGASWYYIGDRLSGASDWAYRSLDIPSTYFTSKFGIGFMFHSDSSICDYEGAYLDDINLDAVEGEPDIRVEPDHLEFDPPMFDIPMHGNASKSWDCISSVMEYVPPMPDPVGAAPKPEVGTLPSEFNWRDHEGSDWTTPAKSQGGCGSCWDFAALGALDAVINIEYGAPTLDLDLSEQYVLSCLPAAGDCEGGHSHWAFEYIKSEEAEGNYVNGIIPESCFPYQADDTVPCSDKCPYWEIYLIPISDYGYWYPVLPSDRGAIKSQLIEKGPIVTYATATDDFINWGSTHHNPNDYYPYPGPVDAINHAVVIVGYKDDPTIGHGGYWIIKNSWGTGFGYEGFYNVEYGSLHHGEFIVYVEYQPEEGKPITVYNDGATDLEVYDIRDCYKEGELSGWLSASPAAFTVSPGSSQVVIVTVNPTGLAPDTYHGWLEIDSNDPDSTENPYIVTVTLTVKDVTPPTIIDHTPTGTDIPVTTAITVTFSEAMNHVSAENAFSISPSVSGSFSWSGNTMIFTPDSDLAYDTTYEVIIDTGAMDLAGNHLQSPHNWQFTTTTSPNQPPSILDIYPDSEKESQGNAIRIYCDSSDPETAESVLTCRIWIRPAGDSWVVIGETMSWDGNNHYYDWSIPVSAKLGYYDVNCTVSDGEHSDWRTDYDEFEVVDTTSPIVQIEKPTSSSPSRTQPGRTLTVGYTYTELNPKNLTIRIYNATDVIQEVTFTLLRSGENISASRIVFIPEWASDGKYSVSIMMYDEAGQVGTDIEAEAIIVEVFLGKPSLLITLPTHSFSSGESATITVTVFNPTSSVLDTTLYIQITGPDDYYYFDSIPILVDTRSLASYTFIWAPPSEASSGTYTVEAGLIPPVLTVYDADYVEIK